MSSPGILFNALFDGDEAAVRKILYGAMLFRDWDGAETSLTGFAPITSDGLFSSTLFDADNPGGPWYDVGYVDEKGWEFNEKFTTKPTRVAQSRYPVRWDYTEQTAEVSATLMESNPVVDALRDNRSLSDLPVIGTPGYSSAAPVEREILWRQCIVLGNDGAGAQAFNIVRVYPKILVVDLGKTNWSPNDPDSLPIHLQAVPDPYSVPPDGVTVGSPRWILRGGPAWNTQGSPTVWPSPEVPPSAVAGASTGLATLTFAQPTSSNGPFTYAVTQYTVGGASAASTGTATTTSGSVSIPITDLTSGDLYTFTVVATGTGGPSGPSLPSNAITAP